MAPGLGLLLGLALAADGVEFDASVAGELRGRSLHVFGQPWNHTLVVSAHPQITVVGQRADLLLSTTYHAFLLAPDALTTDQVDVLHELHLLGSARPSPGLQIEADAVGGLGTSSLVQDARREDTVGDPISTIEEIRRYQVTARLTATSRWSPLTTGTATLSWYQGGGSDAESRVLLPEQRILRFHASLNRRVTRVNELGLDLRAEEVRFSQGEQVRLFLLSATWRVRLLAGLDGWASAGAGHSTISQAPRSGFSRTILAGEIGLMQVSDRGLSQRLVFRAIPAVARLTGAVDSRYEGELTGTWAWTPAWSLTGRSVAALYQREVGDARLLLLELRLERLLGRSARLGGGLYGVRQRTDAVDLPAFFEAGAFLSGAWSTGRR